MTDSLHLLPAEPLRVLSLFAGIGGIDLGLERAGMQVVAHAEIDPYASKVLAKHWPDVPNLGDVTTIDWTPWIGKVDVIAGGFPCQDVSLAGKRAGLKEGTRSGLWSHFARAIGVLRPRYVIVENVPGLASSGGTRVVADLAGAGYVGRVVPLAAADVGAPHLRKRIFIVAHANGIEHESGGDAFRWPSPPEFLADAPAMQRLALVGDEPHGDHAGAGDVADAQGLRWGARRQGRVAAQGQERHAAGTDPHADSDGCEGEPAGHGAAGALDVEQRHDAHGLRDDVADADHAGREEQWGGVADDTEHPTVEREGWWSSEPDVGRVADGVPSRVDRLRCLGNAVVPQCAYVIGRIVVELENQRIGAAA